MNLCEVIFLAGRLGLDDDGWPVAPLLDRLEHEASCLGWSAFPGGRPRHWDPRLIEIPSLANRWLKPLIRRLRIDGAFEHASLLHVLHEEMAELALFALAEACQLPYLQTVDDFAALTGVYGSAGAGSAASWSQAPIWPASWPVVWGFPAIGSACSRRGSSAPEPRPGFGWRIPVIGTAGPPEGSGFGCFLPRPARFSTPGTTPSS